MSCVMFYVVGWDCQSRLGHQSWPCSLTVWFRAVWPLSPPHRNKYVLPRCHTWLCTCILVATDILNTPLITSRDRVARMQKYAEINISVCWEYMHATPSVRKSTLVIFTICIHSVQCHSRPVTCKPEVTLVWRTCDLMSFYLFIYFSVRISSR